MLNDNPDGREERIGQEIGRIIDEHGPYSPEMEALLVSIDDQELRTMATLARDEFASALSGESSIVIQYEDGTTEIIERFDPKVN